MSIFSKLFPSGNEKVIKEMDPIIEQINKLEPDFVGLSDEELKAKTKEFKSKLAKGATLDDLLVPAFAAAREAAKRVLGQRHYDVQLIGGIVLHRGEIAEMKTGEGKTLVATLPLYLNALEGKGAHLITVNDYLARVGAGWMAPVYHALGLSTGVIVHDAAFIYDPTYIDEEQFDERLQNFRRIPRREAYHCDITYGTNNEFGFDYLRDNMVYSLDQTVQRTLHYSIVDEIDSILIDEARTPLIISAPAEESGDKYAKFASLIGQLNEETDYNIDEKMKASTLTEAGINKMEKLLGMGNIYVEGGVKEVHHLEQALKARVLFKRDKDYVVKDGEIVIVDEFTGRMMPGRRYSEGLHQAIEAKEGVKVQKESQTMATITFQNLFRMYKKLSGMTGTAETEAEEFYKIYGLETIIIPTNKPNVRKDLNDLIYRTEDDKFNAVIREVKERNKSGQPILIGTISIEKNEKLTEMMALEGLHPQMLNAKNHLKEAQIIAQAGKRGSITLATNMAGRGVDIILGGNPSDAKEQEEVHALGGLHVIGTERHESRRIDNQLRGRAGRQGDPGSSQFYVSTDDDLMRVFGGDKMKSLMQTLNVPADMPIENKMISKSIESAQKKVEGNNFDMRKHLVEYDDVINKQRVAIYNRRREIIEISEAASIEDKESEEAIVIEGELNTHKSEANEVLEEDSPKRANSLSEIILSMLDEEINSLVSFHSSHEESKEWNIQEIYETMRTVFSASEKMQEDLLAIRDKGGRNEEIREALIAYLKKETKERYKALQELFASGGLNFQDVEKGILIRSIDQLWVEHLETIDYLRRGIGLRGYGQRDPLVEYKKESFHLYKELLQLINRNVSYSIFKAAEGLAEAAKRQLDSKFLQAFGAKPERALQFSGAQKVMQKQAEARNTVDLVSEKVKNEAGEKVGRNEPCPCGSGKKFKHCHGK